MPAFVDLETRVPLEHPLRTIKRLADEALASLSPVFDQMYAEEGRPSIPPERLLKASPLITWVALGRALHGRRHPDRRRGQPQELPAQGPAGDRVHGEGRRLGRGAHRHRTAVVEH